MKKTLLSMAAMMLLAAGVNAQKFDSKVAQKADLSKLANRNKVELNVASTSTVNHNGMKKAGEESQYVILGFMPESEEASAGITGFPSYEDAMGVGAQMPFGEEAYGYKVVAVRFAVVATLGESPDDSHPVGAFVNAVPSDKDATSYVTTTGVDLPEDSYELSEINGNSLDVKWNDVDVTPFTIDNTMSGLMWGLYYVQNTDKNSDDAYPFIYSIYGSDEDFPDANDGYYPFLALGTLGTNGFNWYVLSDSDYPYAVCVYVICEMPNGETAILGMNGSNKPVTQQYYTVDGKRLSAPQKGLNIVKLSNGETQKVYVK